MMGNDGIAKFTIFTVVMGALAFGAVFFLFPSSSKYGGFAFGEGVLLVNALLIALLVRRLLSGPKHSGSKWSLLFLFPAKLAFIGLSGYVGLEILGLHPLFLLAGAGTGLAVMAAGAALFQSGRVPNQDGLNIRQVPE